MVLSPWSALVLFYTSHASEEREVIHWYRKIKWNQTSISLSHRFALDHLEFPIIPQWMKYWHTCTHFGFLLVWGSLATMWPHEFTSHFIRTALPNQTQVLLTSGRTLTFNAFLSQHLTPLQSCCWMIGAAHPYFSMCTSWSRERTAFTAHAPFAAVCPPLSHLGPTNERVISALSLLRQTVSAATLWTSANLF